MGSRAVGALAINTSTAGSLGKAAGHEPYEGTMILALAVRHRTERPAMSMGGGENPMERLPSAV